MTEGRGSGDPGPVPAAGLHVRPERTGFHARVWPRPPVPLARVAGAAAVCGGAGLGLTWGVGETGAVGAAAAASLAGFGALGAVVSWLPGLAPVELEVDDDRVYFDGERYGWDRVGGARAGGGCLSLLDRGGQELVALRHLQPGVGEWLAAAITASVPRAPGEAGTGCST